MLLGGLGVGVTDQVLLFHDSTKVPEEEPPTAIQLLELVQETLLSTPGLPGLDWLERSTKMGPPQPIQFAGPHRQSLRQGANSI